MEGASLHGTLHATIYEVDRLHTGGGSNLFSMVHLHFWIESSFCILVALPICSVYFDYEFLVDFLRVFECDSFKFSDLWMELNLRRFRK